MKYIMIIVPFFISFSLFAFIDDVETGEDAIQSIYYSEKSELKTYSEAEKYCREDGDDYWIPHLKLLIKVKGG